MKNIYYCFGKFFKCDVNVTMFFCSLKTKLLCLND